MKRFRHWPRPQIVSGLQIAGLVVSATTLIVMPVISGCSHSLPSTDPASYENQIPPGAMLIPGNQEWVDTGIQVAAGDNVTVIAGGRIVVHRSDGWGSSSPVEVGPQGTYLFDDEVAERDFPLPSAGKGPAPCYSLIGRIGNGPAFFVGQQKSWRAETEGALQLGINDFHVGDNSGQFYAQVTKPAILQPIAYEEVVSDFSTEPTGEPQPQCSVVVFYVDGLRPDVVREMASMGHIPNIKSIFLDGGVWMSNAFTAFPSDTITSNGTMWTGCFSDRHGLKGQVRFSRRTLASESYLDPLGPSRSARLLSPQGMDALVREAQGAAIRMVEGEEESERWRRTTSSEIPPLYAHLRNHGGDWATGVLPMMTEAPPLLWTRSMARHMPYFHSQEAWKYIDDANSHYAVRHLIPRHAPVTIIWLPETDSVSHKQCRGQFGMTRRTIARADRLLGKVVDELEAQLRLNHTYFLLVSDHGHHGGRTTHLSHFDIANQVIFRPREMTADGEWVGGGLGLSVRQHRSWNRHLGDGRREFVFIDGDSDGAARLFFPKKHFRGGDWSGPNRPADLLAYQIADHLPPLNLVEVMTGVRAVHGSGTFGPPIDLVLMKLTDDSILISTCDRGHAVIHRKRHEDGRWLYRYTPVSDLQPSADGSVSYRPVAYPQKDPLRLLEFLQPEALNYYYDEREWLNGTAHSHYPDGVVALTRHMLWQENIKLREQEFAPDLVVTARPGWYFGTQGSPGTMHGYPLPDAMRASFFVSGPNVRRGTRIETPCRLADLTPTILELVGVSTGDKGFDGRPLRGIFETPESARSRVTHPVYWQDVDLQAWKPLTYTPLEKYEHLPVTVNQPSSAFDLNNIAYNALTIGELSVFRLFDDILSPLPYDGPTLTAMVDQAELQARRTRRDWVSEGSRALNVSEVTLGDYSLTSLGNMKRIDGAVDWVQRRSQDLDRRLAEPIGETHIPGSRTLHRTIDVTQMGFWELYRFAQRVIIQVLDETVINGIENGVDHTVNSFRRIPPEVLVEDPGRVKLETEPPGRIALDEEETGRASVSPDEPL